MWVSEANFYDKKTNSKRRRLHCAKASVFFIVFTYSYLYLLNPGICSFSESYIISDLVASQRRQHQWLIYYCGTGGQGSEESSRNSNHSHVRQWKGPVGSPGLLVAKRGVFPPHPPAAPTWCQNWKRAITKGRPGMFTSSGKLLCHYLPHLGPDKIKPTSLL